MMSGGGESGLFLGASESRGGGAVHMCTSSCSHPVKIGRTCQTVGHSGPCGPYGPWGPWGPWGPC